MRSEIERYQLLEALTEQFRAEALDLLAIAEAAGDTRAEAVEWATDDVRIGKLFDQIEALKATF